jgi:transposase
LEPLLAAVESLSERIGEYDERIEQLAQQSYPQVALLKQVKGVGRLIALTYLLNAVSLRNNLTNWTSAKLGVPIPGGPG